MTRSPKPRIHDLTVLGMLLFGGCLGVPAWATEIPDHVAAIFSARCERCHGTSIQKSELDLTSIETIQRGAESGSILLPGQPEESRLWEVLANAEMPPSDEGAPLSDEQLQEIHAWIASLPAWKPRGEIHQHTVLPILLGKCAECHGRQKQEGGLDVRTLSTLLRGGDSGPSLVPGDANSSLIVQRIREGEMPPRDKLAKYSVKPVNTTELQRLEAWVEAGAPWKDIPPDGPSAAGDPLVSAADRQHWAFRPPRLPKVPQPISGWNARNGIDRFIQARLTGTALRPAAETNRATLARRVTFDLIGLPPDPLEIEAFHRAEGIAPYETLVDRLLASPNYGERWGQYWLDLAGYADSEGVQHADPVRPHAFRYRDYVIRAFNQDKPYRRFLQEQIAGDELANYPKAATITEEIYDNLVATGFLRMSSDGTFAGITGFLPNRLDVIDDQIRILSSSVMGLTIRCARCHSHKFDPIPQRDYYRLAAVLKGAMDEFDWLRPIPGSTGSPRYLPFVTTRERQSWQQHEDQIQSQLALLRAEKKSLEQTGTPDKVQLEALSKRIQEIESRRRLEPKIRALWDNGEPSPTYLLVRGDYQQPGRVVGPGVPSVLTDGKTPFGAKPPWPGAAKTGNRLALATWLTQPHHPLTSRVLVNRVWKHHFGRGLVEPLDDFGRAGGTPSHPELLDWLAIQFERHDYSIKWLHRLIVTSATYRQSSRLADEHRNLDPENRWLARMPLRRMDAEVVRDSLIAIAGKLNHAQFGPADGVDARQDGLVTSQAEHGAWRRSIYIQKRRTQRLTILDNFDRPRMSPNCVDRTTSNVAPQALHLMNNRMIRELSLALAKRITTDVGHSSRRQLTHLALLAWGRPPTAAEYQLLQHARQTLTQAWLDRDEGGESEETVSLANACHAVMNSAAFLYID